jgi:hypothetical protein
MLQKTLAYRQGWVDGANVCAFRHMDERPSTAEQL